MGKLETIYQEKLIDPKPDRHCNRLSVERSNNGELHIHYRNLKIAIIDEREQEEWIQAFKEAKDNLGDYFKNDI